MWCVGFIPKKELKKKDFTTAHFWNDTHTHKSQRTSVTHSLSHTNMTGTWLWLPDGFSTLEHGTRWFRMMYTDHSIFSYLSFCVFALLIFFFSSFKCTCMALGRSGALLISINILFKNKRSTVYNTFHNHTWFLHKNVAKHRFPVYHGHPLLQVQISHLPASCPQRALGRCHSLCQAAVWGELE